MAVNGGDARDGEASGRGGARAPSHARRCVGRRVLRYHARQRSLPRRRWARAQPLFEESLRAFRELGDEHYTLLATRRTLRGRTASSATGTRAGHCTRTILRRARAQGNERMEALQLGSAGDIRPRRGPGRGGPRDAEGGPSHLARPRQRRAGCAGDLGRFADVLAAAGRAEARRPAPLQVGGSARRDRRQRAHGGSGGGTKRRSPPSARSSTKLPSPRHGSKAGR